MNVTFSKIWIPIILLMLVATGVFASQYFNWAPFASEGQEEKKTSKEDTVTYQEKIIFSVRYHTPDFQERDSYILYSINFDGSSQKPIFSYTPDTASESIIWKMDDEKIILYRVEDGADTKILNVVGEEINPQEANYYAVGRRAPIGIDLSPAHSKSLYSTRESDIEIYHRATRKAQQFAVDLQVPGGGVPGGFVDENHITVVWGDLGAGLVGLVELDYENETAEIIDRQSFSVAFQNLLYLDAKTVLAYENQLNDFGTGPPTPPSVIYTKNFNTQERVDLYRGNEFAIYSISFSHDKSMVVWYGMKNGEPALLTAEVSGITLSNFQHIELPVIPWRGNLVWGLNSKKIIYISKLSFEDNQQSSQEIFVVDLEEQKINRISTPSMISNLGYYVVNVVGVFKEVLP